MNKKMIQNLGVKSIIAVIGLFSFVSPVAYATGEVSLSDLRNTVMLTSDENSLINNAIDRVTKLQTDIETITEELFKLDELEKEKNPDLDTSYRQARLEIVRVISSIDNASSKISLALNKLITYQKQMKKMLKELKENKISVEKAKEYLSEYMALLYKMQLKIYDQDGENIDEIRLFINSDNFNETFIGNDLISAMTVQLGDIIEKTTKEEEKQTNILVKLGSLKIEAQKNIEIYRNEIESLEQKKTIFA